MYEGGFTVSLISEQQQKINSTVFIDKLRKKPKEEGPWHR